MNTRLFITAATLFGASLVCAQNVAEDPKPDPVMDAIQKFSRQDQESLGEATPPPEPQETHPPSPEPQETAPIRVTGNPSAEIETDVILDSSEQETHASAPHEAKQNPEDGLSVRIEKIHPGNNFIDPTQVKLRAPFPAKPLAQAPSGWRLDASDNAPPFTREVELAAGSKITLSIRPHLMIPDADGVDAFNIIEPGYETSRGYQQINTVGAILSHSIRQLDDDAKKLSSAVDSLQQLLISLPKPLPAPEPIQEPAVLNKPPTNLRKR